MLDPIIDVSWFMLVMLLSQDDPFFICWSSYLIMVRCASPLCWSSLIILVFHSYSDPVHSPWFSFTNHAGLCRPLLVRSTTASGEKNAL